MSYPKYRYVEISTGNVIYYSDIILQTCAEPYQAYDDEGNLIRKWEENNIGENQILDDVRFKAIEYINVISQEKIESGVISSVLGD